MARRDFFYLQGRRKICHNTCMLFFILWHVLGVIAVAIYFRMMLRKHNYLTPEHLLLSIIFLLCWPFAAVMALGMLMDKFMNFLYYHGSDPWITKEQIDKVWESWKKK